MKFGISGGEYVTDKQDITVRGLRDVGICYRALLDGYCILQIGTDATELVARRYSLVHDVSGFLRSSLPRVGDIQFCSEQAAASTQCFGAFKPVI